MASDHSLGQIVEPLLSPVGEEVAHAKVQSSSKWSSKYQHSGTFLLADLKDQGFPRRLDGRARHLKNACLAVRHPVRVHAEADVAGLGLGALDAKQPGEIGPVRLVLVTSRHQVLVELLVDL